MGRPRDQRTAGGGVLLPQGLSFGPNSDTWSLMPQGLSIPLDPNGWDRAVFLCQRPQQSRLRADGTLNPIAARGRTASRPGGGSRLAPLRLAKPRGTSPLHITTISDSAGGGRDQAHRSWCAWSPGGQVIADQIGLLNTAPHETPLDFTWSWSDGFPWNRLDHLSGHRLRCQPHHRKHHHL